MIPGSLWDQHNVTDLIREILRAVPPDTKYGTGRPFLTTYQIAIEFMRRFPVVAATLGHPAGGQGQGPYALTSYIARWLPDRIVNRGMTDIEFRFLSAQDMTSLQFDNNGSPMTTTSHLADVWEYDEVIHLLPIGGTMSGFTLIIKPDEEDAEAAEIFVDGTIGGQELYQNTPRFLSGSRAIYWNRLDRIQNGNVHVHHGGDDHR